MIEGSVCLFVFSLEQFEMCALIIVRYEFFKSLKRMERKILQQREVIRSANAEKRQERQDKNEAIRVKYGERVFFVFSLLFSINLIFFIYSPLISRSQTKDVHSNRLDCATSSLWLVVFFSLLTITSKKRIIEAASCNKILRFF